MKFTEIPQFTSIGSYQVNMPFRYLKDRIEEDVKEHNLQLNPDFQRGHVWIKEQQTKYIEYLLKGGQSARIIYFNHPSWMGVKMSDKDEYVCVDGLQRLTACLEFLSNKLKVFGLLYQDFEDKIPFNIDLLFNVNNLKTKKEVLQWYLEMNTGGTIHTEEEINRVKELLKKEI